MTTYGSMCSGIEAATVAWHQLGWKAAWFSEIEPFPCAVLEHHYPDTLNVGDMTSIARLIGNGSMDAPDVLVGGTPCQAFSIAGLRAGLDDARGQLTIEFIRIADVNDERRIDNGQEEAVVVWENVPGVLSSRDNAFGCLLAGLAGESEPLEPTGARWPNAGFVLGPKRAISWRVFDAQYFRVAQRRRRVFLVASARKGFDPSAVLFEFDGLRRDIAPSREAQKAVAALTANGVGICGADDNQGQAGHLIPSTVCGALTAKGPATNGAPEVDAGHVFATSYRQTAYGEYTDDGSASTVKARDHKSPTDLSVASESMEVRRLTPTECERLQGFPDNYTLIPDDKQRKVEFDGLRYLRSKMPELPREMLHRMAADGPRYKALGNSMAVPCMRWIGKRIDLLLRGLPINYDPDLDL